MSIRAIATRCLPPPHRGRPTQSDFERFRDGCRGLGIKGTDDELDKLARTCLELKARNKRRRTRPS